MVNVAVAPGYYLVRLSTDFSGTLQGPSQYRLSIRARFLAQFLTDGEFDEEPLDPAWKLKNAGRPPKIVHGCNDYCFIHFSGAAGGKIQQMVQSPGQMKAKVGDYFVLTTYINSTPAAGSNIKFTLQLNYSDGTPPTKVAMVDHVVQISTSNTTYSVGGGLAAEIKSKALKSIKVRIISPSAADVFRVHSATLSLSAGSSVRAPLPVPPSP
jgi:hypothetical protein